MFTKTALAAALALSCALAAPYEPYDHDAMIKTAPDGSRALDIGGIYRSVDNLCAHACEYPLNFDSGKDAEIAYQDAQALEEIFKFLSHKSCLKRISTRRTDMSLSINLPEFTSFSTISTLKAPQRKQTRSTINSCKKRPKTERSARNTASFY